MRSMPRQESSEAAKYRLCEHRVGGCCWGMWEVVSIRMDSQTSYPFIVCLDSHVFETAWFRTRKMASAAALKPQRCAIWVDCCVSDGDPSDVQTLLEHSDPFSTCSKGQGISRNQKIIRKKLFSAKMFGSLIRGTLSAVNPSWSFKLFWHSGSLQRAAQIWRGEIVEMR